CHSDAGPELHRFSLVLSRLGDRSAGQEITKGAPTCDNGTCLETHTRRKRSTFLVSNHTRIYPRLAVEATGTSIVSHAGAALLLRAADKTGLASRLSDSLAPWRKPLAVHDPGKTVLDLAVAVALGGGCLADVSVLRGQRALF